VRRTVNRLWPKIFPSRIVQLRSSRLTTPSLAGFLAFLRNDIDDESTRSMQPEATGNVPGAKIQTPEERKLGAPLLRSLGW
jgi:hypothetical protein